MNCTSSKQEELGDFLRTHRNRVSPSQAGLPEGTRRRTPGLRREEVASLSGISLTWYTWLEQGRDIQVSAQVLESLARVLLLNEEEIRHLYTLANQMPPQAPSDSCPAVTPVLQHILDSLSLSPALLLDLRWNILAWNNASLAAMVDFRTLTARDRNYLRLTFTDVRYRSMLAPWPLQAKSLLARFRAASSQYLDDPWLSAFVKELSHDSPDFARWWALHDVEGEQSSYKVLRHPTAGTLTFEHAAFLFSDNPNLKLFINTPAPGTDTEDKMKRLLHLPS